MHVKMYAFVTLIVLFGFGGPLIAAKKATLGGEIDAGGKYLRIVKAYADTMLRDGRDTYGQAHSPLFATTLDRKTVKIFDDVAIGKLFQERLDDWDNWRIRNADRYFGGANPHHHMSLYQILYALTDVTGDNRYAAEADKALRWFFNNCQSPATGLLAWGEHMGWDFRTESIVPREKYKHKLVYDGMCPVYAIHEFAGPWVLWEQSFDIAPGPCLRFAKGLWENQIGDHKTGNYSRHANYAWHGTLTNDEYPRHGGFYIATWAHAYARTKDPFFTHAIETLVDYMDGRRSPQSDGIPAESAERSKGQTIWTTSNVSLAVDMHDSAEKVPQVLGEKMLKSAGRTDRVFLKLGHDLSPGGKGFLLNVHTHTLEPKGPNPYTNIHSHAGTANLCLLRYRQTKLAGYRKLVLDAAKLYLAKGIESGRAVIANEQASVIFLLAGAYEMTNDKRYLERADFFAKQAVKLFLTEGSPLPQANTKYTHYEAVAGPDTLMMALLKLHLIQTNAPKKPRLVYSHR